MKQSLILSVAALMFSLPLAAEADDDYKHFKGEPSQTLEQAVANLSTYNRRLETALSGELTPEAMNEVHQLTYTLENALGKLDDELEDIAERLEKVHKASERADPGTVKRQGSVYLEKSRVLLQ
ncbi:DUF6746 family protein [Marinobacter daepoensis]|uniref:DUF6746 family protein n=1 Tax=Marinobacter daepoensis TaxID=262077 RepID=UPI000408F82D|nr:DUF6746 family protein [Marinobacter daepoensis]